MKTFIKGSTTASGFILDAESQLARSPPQLLAVFIIQTLLI